MSTAPQPNDVKPDERVRAVEQMKAYLPDPVRRIELYDFMTNEVDKVIESIQDLPIDDLTLNPPLLVGLGVGFGVGG